jgi:phage N-6-adenine-methyltransferase
MPVLYSSATDEWPTPAAFFAKLNRRYQFTLDPCATAENAKCAVYFTKEDDGLKQDWGTHRAFVNPPYGRITGVRKGRQAKERIDGGNYVERDGSIIFVRFRLP